MTWIMEKKCGVIQKMKISHLFTTSSFANWVVVSNIHGWGAAHLACPTNGYKGFPTLCFYFPPERWGNDLRWAVLPFFPFCKYRYIWHDMHGCRGWGGIRADNDFRFMVHVDFQVDRECFSWWCSCGCLVVVGFVVCFFVRWCFCCGCCCCGFCCFCVSLFVFCFFMLLLLLMLLLVLYGRWWAKAVKTVGNKTQGREISCQQPCTPTSK